MRRGGRTLVSAVALDATHADLLARVVRLEGRVRRLTALLRVLLARLPLGRGRRR